MSTSAKNKPSVYITRRVPKSGVELLKHLDVSQWDDDDPVPRTELLKNVAGKDALFCLLTEKIDDEVLDAAGTLIWTNKCKAAVYVRSSVIFTVGCTRLVFEQ